IQILDFEAELAALKTELLTADPTLAAVLDLESEPLVKLLQVFAYRILLKKGEINAKVKALLLAYATGSDLDHLAANVGVARLLIQVANPAANPPTEAIYESDTALRRRVLLAAERDCAGSQCAYQYWALSADGDVRDVSIVTPSAGVVEVYLQSRTATTAAQTLLDTVATALDSDTHRPFTDSVSVLAATPRDIQISATLTLFPGPDQAVVLANANAALDRYIEQVSYLGYDVTLSGLYAALHQAGVQRVELLSPTQNIVIPASQYARVISRVIAAVEYRDV
ncbi:MAG: baseplate J/gp47 family protein, partial [Flavobacteriales bacterium]